MGIENVSWKDVKVMIGGKEISGVYPVTFTEDENKASKRKLDHSWSGSIKLSKGDVHKIDAFISGVRVKEFTLTSIELVAILKSKGLKLNYGINDNPVSYNLPKDMDLTPIEVFRYIFLNIDREVWDSI
jgi:hypothetical protein